LVKWDEYTVHKNVNERLNANRRAKKTNTRTHIYKDETVWITAYMRNSHKFFTVRIRRQFAIKLSPQIPPHLKCVATLPREMSDDALKPATPLTGCVINADRAWHVAPKQTRLKFSWLCCLGRPSTEGLSMLTIHDSQLAKKNHCRWVGQSAPAFGWSHHWSVASPVSMRRPAARRTHWKFDVKTEMWFLDNNWDNKRVVSVVNF